MDKRKRTGKDSPFWKGGKPHCLTCNKKLPRYDSTYCIHHVPRSGKNSPSWKGGKAKCLTCHKLLTHYDRKYCFKHNPYTFQKSAKGRKMVSKMMKGNQYRKGLLGNGWKGEKASYHPKHSWMNNHYGRPTTCEHCSRTGLTRQQIHWANIDHQYRRVRKDWMRLCAKCHGVYDKKMGLRLR